MRAARALVGRVADVLVRALVAPLAARAGFRVYQANLHRIGDSASELTLYAKMRRLGWRPEERELVIPPPRNRIFANPTLVEYLRRHVRIVESRLAYPLLFRLAYDARAGGGRLNHHLVAPNGDDLVQFVALAAADHAWEARGYPPLLTLDDAHRAEARAALSRAGLGPDDWFVCLHAREGGFLAESAASHHRPKNVDVLTYLSAIGAVTSRGGWVVRMGDPSMRPLPSLERVIDYAHAPWKSPSLDVFLAASCRFWLGTNSGFFIVASAFGVPVLMTNGTPMYLRPWGSRDLYVPKLCRWRETGELVAFERALQPDVYFAQDVSRLGIDVVDNDPDELAAATSEMLAALDGERPENELAERLQRRFAELAPPYPHGLGSRVAADFLIRHRELLRPGGDV